MLGNMSVAAIIMVFVAFGCLVTNAVNNVVCVNIFIPIGAASRMTLDGGTTAVSILTSLLAIVLYLGLMHGNSEWLQVKKYLPVCGHWLHNCNTCLLCSWSSFRCDVIQLNKLRIS